MVQNDFKTLQMTTGKKRLCWLPPGSNADAAIRVQRDQTLRRQREGAEHWAEVKGCLHEFVAIMHRHRIPAVPIFEVHEEVVDKGG